MTSDLEKSSSLQPRYIVGYDSKKVCPRVIVFVYDTWIGRVVYKINCKQRKSSYDYIQKYYGIDNCVAPKELNIEHYE